MADSLTGSRPRLRQAATEGLIVVALIAASLWYGRFAFLHAVTPPDYYYLAPAISVAAGQGFLTPTPVPGTPLADFLARRVDSLALRDVRPQTLGEPEAFDKASRYLLMAVGYWWRVAGISWTNLAGVAAALHAMTVLGAYALLRLFLPTMWSLAGGLWICTSTLQLSFIPHIRDYSKAAFIVAALPLIVALALRARAMVALLAVSAAAGATIGIGFGFRMDTAVMIPLAVAAIVLFRGGWPWRALPEKALALAVFLLCLAAPMWPVVSQLARGGSNESHVVLLGYADAFDVNLEIAPSIYRFIPFYSDTYVAIMVSGYATAFTAEPLAIPSPEYGAASRRLWLELVRHFPADVYARGVAAATVVMDLAFHNPDPSFLDLAPPARDWWVGVYRWLDRFSGTGPFLGVGLILVASAASLRHGLLATMMMLVLAGYPSLQFSDRHYFHVQVVPVFTILVLLWLMYSALVAVAARLVAWPSQASTRQRLPLQGAPRRLAVGVLVVLALTAAPLGVLRAYQEVQITDMITGFLGAARTPVSPGLEPLAHGGWLARWPQPEPQPRSGRAHLEYYMLEFYDDGSGAEVLVGLRYAAATPDLDFSRVLSLTPAPGTNRLGFAVLTIGGQSSFTGIEFGAHTRQRFTGAYRVDAGPAGLPFDLLLPGDWRRRHRFQRLDVEASLFGASPRNNRSVSCATGRGCQGLLGILDRVGEVTSAHDLDGVTVHAPIARVTSNGLEVDGLVENESAYLAQAPERLLPTGGAFVAMGELGPGSGAVIGLLKDRAWYGQAFVKVPGQFLAIVPTEGPGTYSPLVTNAMSPGQRRNRLTISKAGFIETTPEGARP
jgi:hypothetical protein